VSPEASLSSFAPAITLSLYNWDIEINEIFELYSGIFAVMSSHTISDTVFDRSSELLGLCY
jgi:hypothetical protein